MVKSDQSISAATELDRQIRNATNLGSVSSLLFGVAAVYAIITGSTDQLVSILPALVGSLLLTWFSRTGRHIVGSLLYMGFIALQAMISSYLERGVGISGAIAALALISGTGLATLPRQNLGRVLIAGLLAGIVSILVDLYAPSTRPLSPSADIRWIVSLLVFLLFAVYFIRLFSVLDIRTKVVFGILAIGAVSLGILALFAVDRAGRLTNSLSNRLETSVRQRAEEVIANTVSREAVQINEFFNGISKDVESLAKYRASLENQKDTLSLGTYWDASTKLFQFSTGQIGNSPSEVSSVFIPAGTEVDESILGDLNTSAYLDFSAPKFIEANPSILAIYYIDSKGVVRYYPNINLASVLAPDFDARQRPYYQINEPLFNASRTTRWAIPYIDATGAGLVVTVASPVYFGDQFNGVVAADIQLARATELVTKIKIGQSGFAYLIDDAGRSISMPPAGYAMFGIDPANLPREEFFKQTLLGAGSLDLSSVTRRMVAGGSGLNTVLVNGVDTYIAYAPITSNGYSIALVVPVSEMQGAIAAARNETQLQISSTTRLAAIIFIGLLFVAILASFVIGRQIAAPITQLTETANKIISGDITAQAGIVSQDEIGILSRAFNTMTYRLRETLEGLEQRVQDRTADLLVASEKIERRASQFEAITQISRVINQTQNLQDLLPQITQMISQYFNFYHVGIFLLDLNNEFAVLAAANSEGGQRMLARSHKLKVGQVGIVGYVAGSGIPRIALDTGADASYFNNPDLPETHSEMALPLFGQGHQVIGVMDVQSIEVNAFAQEDIQVLSTLAEQVSVAISNSRLYEETQRALIEAEMVYRGDLRSGWLKFTKALNLAGIRRRGTKSVLLSEPVNLPGLETVLATGNMVEIQMENNQSGTQLTLPIKLRGQVVGVLNLRSDEGREWTKDQIDIVNAIAERAALSIESSRLLSESQKQAAKERVIGEISAKVSSFSNRDNILQTAVAEIGRSLPGAEVVIQLQDARKS